MRLTTLVAVAALLFLAVLTARADNDAPGALDPGLLDKYQQEFQERGDSRAAINALTANSVRSLSLDREKLVRHNKFVNHKVETGGITHQRSSGRCWLFAALNVLTPKVMDKLNVDEFELSQPYLTFYDRLEKANTFLERIIAYRDRPLNDRTLQAVIEYTYGDGGWWHYAMGLIEKYGVVPISAMPETKQSISTGVLNKLTRTKLRCFASELRKMHQDGKSEKKLRRRKEEMLSEIYQMLVLAYGPPPEEFLFRYEPKKSKDSSDSTDSTDTTDSTEAVEAAEADEPPEPKWYTPASFYQEFLSDEMREYVSISNNPTRDFDEVYQIESSRNMHEKSDMTVLNLPAERLKHYTHKALLDSQVVFFACDVGKENLSDSGIFMVGIYDYGTTFGLDFSLTKEERIAYHDISPNHAMAITGVDTTRSGIREKWLVENSWGSKRGDKGFWYMYDSWFDEYVLVVVIDKGLLEPDDLESLTKEPIQVPAWDPFFLALRNL